MKSSSPDYGVPALEKGLDVLEALAGSPRPLRLGELAEELGRTPNELFRMVVCLEKRGYIWRPGGGSACALSLKLLTLARRHSPQARLLAAARDPMRRLAVASGESCHLSVLERSDLVVIAQEECSGPARLSVPVGGRFPAARTASGRLLMAFEPDRAGGLGDQALARRLESIRKSGISLAEDETLVGVWDVAVLVGGSEAPLRAALAVSGLKSRARRVPPPSVRRLLREAAREITGTLQIPGGSHGRAK